MLDAWFLIGFFIRRGEEGNHSKSLLEAICNLLILNFRLILLITIIAINFTMIIRLFPLIKKTLLKIPCFTTNDNFWLLNYSSSFLKIPHFGKTCIEEDLRKCFAFSPDFPPKKSFRTWWGILLVVIKFKAWLH